MSDTEALTVTLPGDIAADIQAQVGHGRYDSVEAVVSDGMRSWLDQERRRGAIRDKVMAADLDPRPSVPDDLVGRHFEERLARSLALREREG